MNYEYKLGEGKVLYNGEEGKMKVISKYEPDGMEPLEYYIIENPFAKLDITLEDLTGESDLLDINQEEIKVQSISKQEYDRYLSKS